MASERIRRDSPTSRWNSPPPRYWPGGGIPTCAIEAGRVMTSSGAAPTGGVPAGGAVDRVQPDRSRWLGGNSDRTDSADNEGVDPASATGLSPSLGGVSGATPPPGTIGSVGAGSTAGEAAYPQPGSSGALMGDVGAGMAGEEEIDDERVVR